MAATPDARRTLRGAAAAILVLAGIQLAHAGAPRLPSPPLALADRLIRWTPGAIATWGIENLGHAASQLLALGAAAALVIAAAGLARWLAAWPAGAAFSALLALAAWSDPVPGSPSARLVVAAGGGLALAMTMAALEPSRVHADQSLRGPVVSRRRFLRAGAAAVGVLAGGTLAGRLLAALWRSAAAPLEGAAAGDALPPRRLPLIAGLTPEVTPVADHYVVDIDLEDPIVDAGSWRLEVGGLVERPLALGFEELQQVFPLVEEHAVLTCISNEVGGPLVGNSAWTGVRLADVLRVASPRPSAVALRVSCSDGYSAGIPLRVALHPAALVAVGQNGQALTRTHGFPCRLRIPALYGMANAKWVHGIELVDQPYEGYWAQQGWAAVPVVRTQSRIDVPPHAVLGEPTWIAGVAWAGVRGIAAVEVSTDGGASWRGATLQPPRSPWAWTQWALGWTPARRGTAVLMCRAVDGHRVTQTARARPPHPSGASGYHRLEVTVA